MLRKEELIKKLFDNRCSRQELEQLFEVIKSDIGANAPEVMAELVYQLGDVPEIDKNSSSRIFDEVNIAIDKSAIERDKYNRKNATQILSKIAATVVILIVTGFCVQRYLHAEDLMMATGYGEIREFELPDGSVVTLNGNSQIQYPSNWEDGENRIVTLEGEAFFNVEKKPATNAKFSVITSDLTIEVLGTEFNVNTRQETTKVFLQEGKVKLNLVDKSTTELFLAPGELLTYSAKTKLLDRPQKIEKELHISWKEGVLTFRDSRLKDILEKLAATNNIEFEIKGVGLSEKKFSIAIPNDNIDVAMDILSKTTKTNITNQGSSYLIETNKEIND